MKGTIPLAPLAVWHPHQTSGSRRKLARKARSCHPTAPKGRSQSRTERKGKEQSRSLRSRCGISIKQAVVGRNSLARLARTTRLLPKVAVNIASQASYGNASLCRGWLASLNGRRDLLATGRIAPSGKQIPAPLKKRCPLPSVAPSLFYALSAALPTAIASQASYGNASLCRWLACFAQRSQGFACYWSHSSQWQANPYSLEKAVSAPFGRSLIIYRSSAQLPTRETPPGPVGPGGER